jgi:hypothetical protein
MTVAVYGKAPAYIRLSLYDPITNHLICKDKLNTTIFEGGLERIGKCLENHVEDKFLPLLHKCWHNTSGIEYPASTTDWINFYCNHREPWIYKNMAEHCFLKRWMNKVDDRDFFLTYAACSNFDFEPYELQGIGSERKPYEDEEEPDDETNYYERACKEHTLDEESDKSECAVRLAHEARMKKICVEKDTKTSWQEIFQHKCIERAAPNQPDIIEFCWNIVMKTQYPETDDAWLNFTCKTEHPYAKKRMVMDCMLYRLGRDNETVFHVIKRECRGTPYPLEDKIYRARNRMEDEEIDEYVKEAEHYNEVCKEDNSAVIKKFNHHNQLRCLVENLKPGLGRTVLDYCWSSFFRKSVGSLPQTSEEWTKFFCPETGAQLIRSGKEVVACFENLIEPPSMAGQDGNYVVKETEFTKIRGKCHRDSIDLDSKK